MSDPPPGKSGIGEVLFVLGAPRSGTTLTSRLLLQYFGYGMGPEGQWIVPFARRLRGYGDLAIDANIRRLIDDIVGHETFRIVREQYPDRFGWPIDVTSDMVVDALPERTYSGVVYAALGCLASQLRRSRVGSKDPGLYRHLDLLHSLFPTQAKYLSVIRDGRDVALSMMKQPWGQKTWYANAQLWVDTYRRIEAFRARIPAGRFLEFRYEDLLRDPDQTCQSLDAFLGGALTDDGCGRLAEEIGTGARRRNFDKWKGRMRPRDHRLYESIAGEWLEHFGYERVHHDARAHWWEHLGYRGQEFGRRARRKLRWLTGRLGEDTPTSTHPTAKGS